MTGIRIIQAPRGEAPQWVRDAWVGLEMPLSISGYTSSSHGVLSGKGENFAGYMVPIFHALRILRARNEKAAQWWDVHLDRFDAADCLVFNDEACEYLSYDPSSLN